MGGFNPVKAVTGGIANGFKGDNSPPPPPDPTQVANQQTASNIQTANYQGGLNRINQSNPLGSINYSYGGVDASGAPIWNSNVSLSPGEQGLFNSQLDQNQRFTDIAGADIRNGSYRQAFNPNVTPLQTSANGGPIQGQLDFSGAPAMPNAKGYQDALMQAQNGAYQKATSYLDPQYKIAHEQLDNQLANQGITDTGSEAYKNAQDQLGRQQSLDYGNARDSAIAAGDAEQQQLFGQDLSARQQGVNEATTQGQFANSAQQQAYAQAMQNATLNNSANAQGFQEAAYQRALPLQEVQALRGMSGAQLPQFQGYTPPTVANTPVGQYAYQSYGGLQDAYNQQMGAQNAQTSSLFGLGGMLGAAAIMA